MTGTWHRRAFFLVAAVAIGIALLMLLIPHDHVDHSEWLAFLPIFFAGLISPLSLLSPLVCAYEGRIPAAPVLAPSFQRPPPFLHA
jgi:hypothetical protein